jgi:hypothetical protein
MLACSSAFLSQAGKLELTNAVLTALPTFHLRLLLFLRVFLNRLTNIESIACGEVQTSTIKKPHKAALEMVCKPKDQRVLDFLISKSKMRLFS